MKRDPTLDRAPLAYHLLDRWMRVIAVLVPKHIRGRWLAEWDGELWYSIAGKRMQPRWRAAAGLAKGLLHDALQVRRLETSNHGRDGGRGDGSMRSLMTDVRYSLRMLRKAPGFATVVVIPLVGGREFDDRDRLDETPVAIIDQHFPDTYFPERDPIGMQLTTFTGPKTIVGIIETIKYDALDRVSRVTVYQPHGQAGSRGMYVTITTAGDPTALAAPVARTVQELDDRLAVVDVSTMKSRLADSLAERRFSMGLLQVLSVVALILATVGIYGLVSYRVNQGARELGLRMAFGAPTGRIMKLVLRHGLALASAGVLTGLVAALVLTGFMRSMLFGVSAVDGWTFATVSAGLVLTTLIACYIPARRATLVDPLESIRSE